MSRQYAVSAAPCHYNGYGGHEQPLPPPPPPNDHTAQQFQYVPRPWADSGSSTMHHHVLTCHTESIVTEPPCLQARKVRKTPNKRGRGGSHNREDDEYRPNNASEAVDDVQDCPDNEMELRRVRGVIEQRAQRLKRHGMLDTDQFEGYPVGYL